MLNPRRLNQLLLTDDTRFGLLLVWVYMILEAVQQTYLGGYWLSRWIGNNTNDLWWSVIERGAQVALLLGLAGAIGCFRLYRLIRQVRPRDLSDADPAFSENVTYIAHSIVKQRPRFLATPNLADTNACCVLAWPQQYVIVGGGLRLLWRKAAAQADSIIAHECVHLAKRDTFLLIGTWYTFIAYTLLLTLNLVLHQGLFWGKVIARVPAWLEAGQAIAGLSRNLIVAGAVGTPPLISALVIGVMLRHILRLREFIADEGAAQQGFRQGLIRNLAVAAENENVSFRLFRSFHPSAADRLERVEMGAGWLHVDRLYCLACGLISARMLEALSNFGGNWCSRTVGEELWGALVNCLSAEPGLWVAVAFFFVALVGVGLLVVHHAYRTLMSNRAERRRWTDTVLVVLEIWAFSMLGVVLGNFTDSRVVGKVAEIIVFDIVPVSKVFDRALASSIFTSSALLLLLVATGIVVSITAKRFNASRRVRFLGFLTALLVAMTLSSFLVNFSILLMHEFGRLLNFANVVGWERSTTSIVQGSPTPVESMMNLIVLALAIGIMSYVLSRYHNCRTNAASDMNSKRLILRESDAVENAIFQTSVRSVPIWRAPWVLLFVAVLGVVGTTAFLRSVDQIALERPIKFKFEYSHGDKAGTRTWTRSTAGIWSEWYWGKVYSTFREVGRINLAGCNGTVVERRDYPAFKVFIPDKRCENKSLMARNGESSWAFLGSMNLIWSIRTWDK
ncbi:M48 family metalloprotease [Achromobacter sp. MFA1 R4]|uniref:M48 family metalloprotease n=1 Tax=Achromobacter sp. MFA1 R4 TaxID=1881016 RepID=UPI00095375D3|nr:M48 family metalloprotease [Achromobacter sp. MFA1 R4]SIT13794.1 hypothetical protein SAMN05428937_1187 [Achromobacter sp. MFA1 R4]